MGTALLLITIGLLVHPAGAEEPGDIPTGGLGNVSENPGSVPGVLPYSRFRIFTHHNGIA